MENIPIQAAHDRGYLPRPSSKGAPNETPLDTHTQSQSEILLNAEATKAESEKVATMNDILVDTAPGTDNTTSSTGLTSTARVVHSSQSSESKRRPNSIVALLNLADLDLARPHSLEQMDLIMLGGLAISKTKNDIMREPQLPPLSYKQLVAEIKSIYKGIFEIEAKCIEENCKEGPEVQSSLEWQRRAALHETLLRKHSDFFLTSQHPLATPELRNLPSKYALPARMWRHGIQAFLDFLKVQLPGSLSHQVSFISPVYSTVLRLLYKTISPVE